MTLCGEDRDIAAMNNELNHLYQRIHASPAITADLPENLGMGRIIRAVSPCGTVVSSWKMKFGSDAAVEGVRSVPSRYRLADSSAGRPQGVPGLVSSSASVTEASQKDRK